MDQLGCLLFSWAKSQPTPLSSVFFFLCLDRNNRREDLPAPDSQESLEQLCGGQGRRCGEALQPRATPRPVQTEGGHQQ